MSEIDDSECVVYESDDDLQKKLRTPDSLDCEWSDCDTKDCPNYLEKNLAKFDSDFESSSTECEESRCRIPESEDTRILEIPSEINRGTISQSPSHCESHISEDSGLSLSSSHSGTFGTIGVNNNKRLSDRFSHITYDGRCSKKFEMLTSILSKSPWKRIRGPPTKTTSSSIEYIDGEESDRPESGFGSRNQEFQSETTSTYSSTTSSDAQLSKQAASESVHQANTHVTQTDKKADAPEVKTKETYFTNGIPPSNSFSALSSLRSTRFQDDLTMKICFINEEDLTYISDGSEDYNCYYSNPATPTHSSKPSSQTMPNSRTYPVLSSHDDFLMNDNSTEKDEVSSDESIIKEVAEFIVKHKQLEDEAKFALNQAKIMSKMQAEIEKEKYLVNQKTKPNFKLIHKPLEKNVLKALNLDQLISLKAYFSKAVQEKNEELMATLIEKDFYVNQQDDLLFDIEDLTRHARNQLQNAHILKSAKR